MSKVTFTQEQQAQINAMIAEAVSKAVTDALAGAKKPPKKKDSIFMKYNTATGKRDIAVECTEAQKKAWERSSENYEERKAKGSQKLEEFEAKRAEYKPTKKFKDALKKKPSMSRKEAAELGFVGTREDLKALKVELGIR